MVTYRLQTGCDVMKNRKKRILIVEDDIRMQQLLSSFLVKEGFELAEVENGHDALELIREFSPDLILLDIMLPDMDGMDVAKTILPSYDGAIIVLTADHQELTEILALNMGVDDFVGKPVRPHILLARIKALLRRVNKHDSDEDAISVQDLIITAATRELYRNDQPIQLTGSEFELMTFLMKNAGKVVTREEIYLAQKSTDYPEGDRTVDMGIFLIRRKLDDELPPYKYIKTVRGKGYVFTTA